MDGDPIATSTLKFKLSKSFKKQLKQNGVKMKPKKLKLRVAQSDVVPTTGKADLSFKKVTFRKGNKKVVYGKLKGKLPGTLKGSSGKLFRLTKAKTSRNGFGADLRGIKVKFLAAAAKKINRKLDLDSLKAANAAKMSLSYQPETVQILGGTASTTGAATPAPPGSPGPYPVGVKLAVAHCVIGSSAIPPASGGTGEAGIQPIAPATQPGGPGTTIFLPVVSGEISPTADDGQYQQSGGVRLVKNFVANGGGTTGDCTNGGAGFPGELRQTDQVVRLGEKDVQSQVNIVAAPPGFAPTGALGTVIGQTLDTTSTVVTADPVNRTISTTGTQVKITETSANSLNGIFPCVNQPGGAAPFCNDGANTAILKGGDLFGSSTLTVTVR